MDRLSTKLTNYILLKGVIEENDFEIYQYGFQRFLELFINIMCSIIIAILLNMKLECIVFFLFFIPLRYRGCRLRIGRIKKDRINSVPYGNRRNRSVRG